MQISRKTNLIYEIIELFYVSMSIFSEIGDAWKFSNFWPKTSKVQIIFFPMPTVTRQLCSRDTPDVGYIEQLQHMAGFGYSKSCSHNCVFSRSDKIGVFEVLRNSWEVHRKKRYMKRNSIDRATKWYITSWYSRNYTIRKLRNVVFSVKWPNLAGAYFERPLLKNGLG